MKRRDFLTLSATTALALAGCKGNSDDKQEPANDHFKSPLLIPPLMEGTLINGVKHFDLSIQKSSHPFFKDKPTSTFAVNGSYLGPTLRLINNEDIAINFTNNLNEHTTIHGHGMHVPAKMDGGLHQVIIPGSTWSAKYKVNQRACTNWYHPHLKNFTAEHTYKGIAGLIIVEDSESINLDLPKTYGVDDIPIVLQDRRFDENREIDYSPTAMEIMNGYIGGTLIVNGVINPYIDVEAKEIRLRIVNGSNASLYKLAFSNNQTFKQIATDNSFLDSPVSLTELRLSPAERAEIVIDLSDKKNSSLILKDLVTNKNFLKINVNKTATTQTTTPNILTNLSFYNASDAVNTRIFQYAGLLINGKKMVMSRIDEIVPINQLEIWEVHNDANMDHNFHLHGTHFTILERKLNGQIMSLLPNENGYKDTVYLAPKERIKLLVKMTDYTDDYSPYMYHCHYLEHEDAGMMGQFTVVEA